MQRERPVDAADHRYALDGVAVARAVVVDQRDGLHLVAVQQDVEHLGGPEPRADHDDPHHSGTRLERIRKLDPGTVGLRRIGIDHLGRDQLIRLAGDLVDCEAELSSAAASGFGDPPSVGVDGDGLPGAFLLVALETLDAVEQVCQRLVDLELLADVAHLQQDPAARRVHVEDRLAGLDLHQRLAL